MISKSALEFLDDLRENNNRDWFIGQKKRYEAYKAEYHDLVAAFLERMKQGDPSLERLEVKNCTFRVNRDIRFTKDKSPYKTHMGVWMNTNLGNNGPGYYVHLERGASFLAGGLYNPEADDLKKVRREIAFFHEDLEEIVQNPEFVKVFGTLDQDNSLKTAPKDFDKDHPAIHFLKLKAFTATAKLTDKEITSKDFVAKASQKLLLLKPLNQFINRALGADE